MKNIYTFIIALVLGMNVYDLRAQCSSCTTTITGTDSANHIIGSGQTFCISVSGTCTGLITVTSGGVLCNDGLINSTNLWVAGGNVYNYGSIVSDKILVSSQGVITNSGLLGGDSMLVTNIYSLLTNNSNGYISEIRLGNSDNASIINNGNITVDYMADSMAAFTNNGTARLYVNMDFANAYNSAFYNYGGFKVDRDFYNSTGSIAETTCMVTVGRDWYNTGFIYGSSIDCGGYSIAGGSYNTGTVGSATSYVDLCDAGHPALGIDGPGGTIASTTTYCSCNNNCIITVGVPENESEDLITALYPNPATNSLNLTVNPSNGELTISIYDMMGRKQSSWVRSALNGTNNLNFDISSLAEGTYILCVMDDAQKQTKKIFSVIK